MLNKKILVGGAGKEAPHVILTVCHHEHIEKYITHWLYRFPSKAPNGRLIRKYLLNLGVTSQLEVPYAA